MKGIIKPLATLFAGMFLLSSCLGDGDDYVYTDDTAITAFALGTLKQYLHTTSSKGEDSTYTKKLDCSDYVFYIDQIRNEVYNPDSLPCGIDGKKILCSVTTKNSGVVGIKSMTSDSLSYFSSSDSTDFTSPRDFYVYSNSGESYRKYTVHVNIHQEEPDTFIWRQTGASAKLAALSDMRAFALGENLYVLGTDGSSTYGYSTADGQTWNTLTMNFNHTLDADAYKGVVTKDGYMYIYDNGTVMRSSDGEEWEVTGTASLQQLIAASPARLYAYDSNGGIVKSSDDGETWTAAELDDDSSLLPTEELTYTCTDSKTNEGTYHLLIVGNRDSETYGSDDAAQVWGKVEETLSNSQDQPWAYYKMPEGSTLKAPRLRGLQTTTYDGGIVAVGGESLGGAAHTPFDYVYVSGDGGITWRKSSSILVPDGFDTTTKAFAIASDSSNFLWLICGKTGQVWRGRINRLGWDVQKTSFTE